MDVLNVKQAVLNCRKHNFLTDIKPFLYVRKVVYENCEWLNINFAKFQFMREGVLSFTLEEDKIYI